MKTNARALVLGVCMAVGLVPSMRAQVALKNNLLYDAALTFNGGIEGRVAQKWTLGVDMGYSPFELGTSGTRRWRHLLVMPEARYWFCEAYSHHFLSLNAVYSHFNAARLDLPLYGTDDYRYQGDFAGAGLSYGYAIPIGRRNHWNLELELGADLCYAWYDKYECDHCGNPLGSESKWFVLPKAAINLAWLLPGRGFNSARAHACEQLPMLENTPWVAPEPEPQAPFVPAVAVVEDNTGRAGQLQKTNPVLAHISEYRPYDNTCVLRKERGMLYVHFPLDKTDLRRDFRSNAAILDNIVDITRQILADSTSDVRKIQIIGLASIEGPVYRNCQLGEGRARALQEYVERQLPATKGLFELNNGCEAWAEFEDQVRDLRTAVAAAPEDYPAITLQNIDGVLDILRHEPDADRREQRLRALNGGRPYNYIRDNILADQRNSGYVRIYYDYVPDEAARTINAATRLLQQERYAEALPLLRTVQADVRAQNALGVALYMTGSRREALAAFERAAAAGNQQARQNLQQLSGR